MTSRPSPFSQSTFGVLFVRGVTAPLERIGIRNSAAKAFAEGLLATVHDSFRGARFWLAADKRLDFKELPRKLSARVRFERLIFERVTTSEDLKHLTQAEREDIGVQVVVSVRKQLQAGVIYFPVLELRLRHIQSQVYVLRQEGLSVWEVACRLGISERSVYNHYYRERDRRLALRFPPNESTGESNDC